MRERELERLVRLELASVVDAGDHPESYSVEIRCHESEVKIRIEDPLTNKTLERTILAPPRSEPEPERLIALSVAQLYRAAWLELAAEDAPPLPPAKPPLRRAEKEIAIAKRVSKTILGINDTASHWSLGGGLGVHARWVQTVLPNLELYGSWAPTDDSYWFLCSLGLEFWSVSRAHGFLETSVFRPGVGVGRELAKYGPWSLFVEALVGADYAHIAATAASPGYQANKPVYGWGFEASLSPGAGWRVGRAFRIEILLRTGLLAGTPKAIIDQDKDLSLNGFWMGGDLRLRGFL
jgi:hypothetical protein